MTALIQLSTWALVGQAESGAVETLGPESVRIQSVWDFVLKGGWMMIPIGLCSLVMLTVVAERLISLRRQRVTPPDFWGGLEAILKGGRAARADAIEYCRKRDCPMGRVAEAGLRKSDQPIELIERSLADTGEREVAQLRRYVRILAVVASVCPLLGLLGTIFGMITAFETVASSAEALGRTELLATGIYQAMITTAAGLSVAIPALIFYHVVQARVEKRATEMDSCCADFVEWVHGLPPVTAALRVSDSTPTDGHIAVPAPAAAIS